MLDQVPLFAGPKTCQHEDGFADSGFPQFNTFGHAGHAEPVCAGFGEGSCHRHSAESVGVSLYNRKDLASVAIRGGRVPAYVLPDGAQVARKDP
jgi:hypothetical protein